MVGQRQSEGTRIDFLHFFCAPWYSRAGRKDDFMRTFRGMLIASSIGVAGIVPASSTSLSSAGLPSESTPRPFLEQAQYADLCGNWRRECARLWGWRTRRWHECMGQPGAIWDCGGASPGYRARPRSSCANWRQQCANLHGWRTQNWYACMEQPGAIEDCQ
jgi:hypothetical protein